VAGACFCCSYSKFVETAAALAAQGAEVILAEPVGSCTDIAATVLKPLLADHARLFHLAPYTVLVDAEQFRAMHAADAGAELAWLYAQQLAEADLLVQSKCDAAAGGLDDVPLVHRLSARTGLGVEEWIELVLSGNVAPASHVLPKLDYARYARAEALMAWLNLSATLTPDEPAGPAQIVGPLFDELDARLSAGGHEGVGGVAAGLAAIVLDAVRRRAGGGGRPAGRAGSRAARHAEPAGPGRRGGDGTHRARGSCGLAGAHGDRSAPVLSAGAPAARAADAVVAWRRSPVLSKHLLRESRHAPRSLTLAAPSEMIFIAMGARRAMADSVESH